MYYLQSRDELDKSRVTAMVAIAVVGLNLFLSGCSFTAPKSLVDEASQQEAPADATLELVKTLEQRSQSIKSARVRAAGKVSYPAFSRNFTLATVFLRPEFFRSEFFFSESNQLVFIVTASLDATVAFDARANSYYQAADDKAAVKAFFGVPFNAEELSLWLLGTFVPAADKQVKLFVAKSNQYLLLLENLDGRKLYLSFSKSWKLLAMEVWEGERAILHTDYEYGATAEFCGDLLIPEKLKIEMFEQNIDVELSPQRCVLNDPKLQPESVLFKLPIPAGATMFDIEPAAVSAW